MLQKGFELDFLDGAQCVVLLRLFSGLLLERNLSLQPFLRELLNTVHTLTVDRRFLEEDLSRLYPNLLHRLFFLRA